MRRAWLSPKNMVATTATTPTTRASLAEAAEDLCGGPWPPSGPRRCQALTPSMSIAAVTRAAVKHVEEGADQGAVGHDGPEVGHDRPVADDLVADRVLHPGVGGQDEIAPTASCRCSRARSKPGGRAARPGPCRRSRCRGRSTPGRTRAGPRRPGGRRRRFPRSVSRRTSSCRTGTPARCRSRRRWRS